ncbi:MAG: long-chain fatty acid--CoA ligase [Desulfobacula sp.]|jgi:long-chain acyl-CoA synthetase|uniref:long-chain-fatty-acid--CoA ligase n=2 Tax=Desulfobacula sp. TaxID=2593537 RepID=UPI001D4BD2F3|nr:long-chain fatty acid--CoA ligase [Desulfobacula sp.]MBT3804461.1 long-chain fatty acid--CoA ligase [Desulfobacula sp.]MBT4024945.1 long-chain fatty acid--CoA ligase [Desulfobacula sp.]MBT4198823.1 long-chain fatty acid--CoA ligase [Desulfobacula sp.]MBT4508513.1 long-chain fatty acid--CoA ligase [Desulfobacula sp.]
MKDQAWETDFWPEGVAHTVSDYNFPIFKFLDDSAKKFPDNVFTIFNGASKTYAQVLSTANRIANFLASNKIGKGDKVAIFLPNLPQFPEILFGILKAGAVAVNCNPVYTPSELNQQLKDSESKMVFCMDHAVFYPNTVKAIEDTQVEAVVVCNIKSYLPKFKAFLGGLLGKIPKADKHEPGHVMFDDIVAKSEPVPPKVLIDPENDTAIMLYTGGTTGVPKGAELTHTNFTYDVLAGLEYIRISQGKGKPPEKLYMGGFHTYLGVLPWYHSFGITVALLSAAMSGSRLICVPDPRAGNPPFTEVLKAVQKYKPTIMPAVPTIFVAFTNHALLNNYDLSSIMGCFSGGAPLPPEVCRQFEEKTGSIIFEGYGLTETAPVASVNPTNREARKIGSIGFPLPGTDIKILNLIDPTKELQKGEDGEIAICGPQVMKGYWKRPDANEEVFTNIDGNRYFLTGDIGHIDDEGYILVTDRKKDMIIVGGFNVYPRDVEDILYTHPKVELCAVIGIPDEKSGEKVKAFIKLKQGKTAESKEIIDFCRENMAGYKRPKSVEFRDEIPVSNIGKVLRRVLREEEIGSRQ